MTHDQIADMTIGLCVLVPMLLAVACWLGWSAWRDMRKTEAFIHAHRAWLARR